MIINLYSRAIDIILNNAGQFWVTVPVDHKILKIRNRDGEIQIYVLENKNDVEFITRKLKFINRSNYSALCRKENYLGTIKYKQEPLFIFDVSEAYNE